MQDSDTIWLQILVGFASLAALVAIYWVGCPPMSDEDFGEPKIRMRKKPKISKAKKRGGTID